MKKNSSMLVAVAALVLSVVALVMCIMCCSGKKNVETALMDKPEIIINAMQQYENKMREQAMASAQQAIENNINEINNNPDSPIIGNPAGEVTLVEFFDFSCGYCHRLAPAIDNIIANNPNVKVVVKPLNFVGPTSDYAARAALAAGEQGKYAQMHNALLRFDGRMVEAKIDEVASNIGLDMDKYAADRESDKIKKIVADNLELASKIQVNGVPTLILEGKMLQTIDEQVIQEAINNLK